VKAVTDDDVTDEAAGAARITMAADSKSRKEKEAQQLDKENATMRKKLDGVQAKVDDDIMDD